MDPEYARPHPRAVTPEELLEALHGERRARLLHSGVTLLALLLIGVYLGSRFISERLPARTPPPAVQPRGELMELEKTQIRIFRRNSPSVVFITNVELKRDWRMNPVRVPRGTGTGFVWDAAGHVVTNYHVVAGAGEVEVGFPGGRTVSAAVVGVYPDKDVAVLKVDSPRPPQPVTLGSSSDLQVGQMVFAIGNPFGLDQTLTGGVVSALGREIETANRRIIGDVIQTDAAINPGNSGGPLLDSSGRVIGITTAILSRTGAYAGIGFAVPIDTVKRVVEQLIAHGRVIRPTLGVVLAPPNLARDAGVDDGVLVLRVVPGSGAAQAGLRGVSRRGRGVVLGDVILAVEGAPVRRLDDLLNVLEKKAPGDEVEVVLRRDGKQRKLRVRVDAPS